MSAPRRLIVTGATGKQGGAVIAALLARTTQPFEIYALTRSKASRSAQSLSAKPNVKVIEGDFNDPAAIFKQVAKPWGMFLMTMPLKGAKLEEQQGKAMVNAAIEAGVKHIVFTATDRGGQEVSDREPTYIPHFSSKYNIEKDIIEKAASSKQGTTWTFLRPVAFMENLTNDFLGKGFIAMWKLNGADEKMQMISTTDVGKVGAEAILNFDTDEFRNTAISLAGDNLSPNQAAKIFEVTTGTPLPSTYSFVGKGLRWGLKEQLGLMFDWIRDVGFGADVEGNRKRYPFMQDFGTWVNRESAWKQV